MRFIFEFPDFFLHVLTPEKIRIYDFIRKAEVPMVGLRYKTFLQHARIAG